MSAAKKYASGAQKRKKKMEKELRLSSSDPKQSRLSFGISSALPLVEDDADIIVPVIPLMQVVEPVVVVEEDSWESALTQSCSQDCLSVLEGRLFQALQVRH